MMKKIILVFKTHFDIGFTDLASNVIQKYATDMLRQVLETCRATEHMGDQKYVWTMPAWPLYQVDRACDGELKKELEHYIRTGQIVWHALPFTSHTDFCGEEEYLEGLRYGKWLSEKYGKPYPIAAKMTDVPGHGRMLPEILGASGIRFLPLGCNAFATPPEVPLLFFWEAPSGRRVLTMYSKGGYGSGLEKPEDWPFPVWMALMHTSDNCGPQSADSIRSLVKEAEQMYPDAEIVCGTMDDFARELEACDLRSLPVMKGDMADTWIHGIGAYPAETGKIRRLRHLSTRMQKYAVQQELLGAGETDLSALDQYYEAMHLFGEHTWGADVKTWLGPERVYRKAEFLAAKAQQNYRFMEASWQEQRERAQSCEESLRKCDDRLRESMDDFRSCSDESRECVNGQEQCANKLHPSAEKIIKEESEYLYNPSSSVYRGWAEWTGGNQKIFGKNAVFVSDLSPFFTISAKELSNPKEPELIVFRGRYCAYVENHRYRLEFDAERGEILCLADRKNGKLLLKKRAGIGLFSYQYHRIGMQRMTDFLRNYGYRFPAWGVQDYGRENYPECKDASFTPEFQDFRIEGSSIIFSYRGQKSVDFYGDAEQVEVTITLPPAGEEIFAELKLLHKQETPFIESGCFYIPLAAEAPGYLINKNGSLLDPAHDIVRNANHVYYALEHLAAVQEGDRGLAVLPLDTPLLSLGEDGCYCFRSQYKETEPILCFNLFNNMWGTNFPQWQGGDFSFRYILRSFDAKEEARLLEYAGLLVEGLQPVDHPMPEWDLTLPDGMELLNLKKEGQSYLLILRDVLGTESLETIRMPGFRLCETDYYGRQSGQFREDSLEFLKRSYGLHIFRVSQSNGII